MSPQKETIYVDVDDDITDIIDRVVKAKSPIAALVLPKRAGVLQSSVNMRLLKRASENAKKSIVLISSEDSILKLAGLTRIHVAKSLTSKPELPDKPKAELPETIISEAPTESGVDPKKSIGELAGDKPSEVDADQNKDEETIELDNVAEEKPAEEASEKLPKKNKKLMVPSFDKFRTRIFVFGTLGLGLIVFLFFAMFVWPRATITVTTENTKVDATLTFSANIAQAALDPEKKVVPAEQKELKTILTEKFTATGKKDNGTHAKGSVKLYNCSKDDKLADITRNVPAGTKISSGDKSFTLDAAVDVQPSSYVGNNCQENKPSSSVAVTAVSGGQDYNLSARQYSVSNFSTMFADGGAMGGGTSNIVTVVSDQDIDTAKQKILAKSSDEYKLQLISDIKTAGKLGLAETFVVTPGEVTSSPKSGEEASDATLSFAFTYQMLGVNPADLSTLLKTTEEVKIDKVNQKIYDDGLNDAKIGQLERPSAGEAKLSLTTSATAGPQLDANTIAKEVAGKKAGETKSMIMSRTGVAAVDVSYDPFWVLKTPKKVSRITIIFDAKD